MALLNKLTKPPVAIITMGIEPMRQITVMAFATVLISNLIPTIIYCYYMTNYLICQHSNVFVHLCN